MLGIVRLIGNMVLAGVAIVPALADPVGSPIKGHRLALKICSACHVVAADQKAAPILEKSAPNFQAIADGSGLNAAALFSFLQTNHRTLANGTDMPNPDLTDDQATDIAAYIMSLRSRGPETKDRGHSP